MIPFCSLPTPSGHMLYCICPNMFYKRNAMWTRHQGASSTRHAVEAAARKTPQELLVSVLSSV